MLAETLFREELGFITTLMVLRWRRGGPRDRAEGPGTMVGNGYGTGTILVRPSLLVMVFIVSVPASVLSMGGVVVLVEPTVIAVTQGG